MRATTTFPLSFRLEGNPLKFCRERWWYVALVNTEDELYEQCQQFAVALGEDVDNAIQLQGDHYKNLMIKPATWVRVIELLVGSLLSSHLLLPPPPGETNRHLILCLGEEAQDRAAVVWPPRGMGKGLFCGILQDCAPTTLILRPKYRTATTHGDRLRVTPLPSLTVFRSFPYHHRPPPKMLLSLEWN